MQIREHVSDKPAVILYPSGTVVTFAELEARANRLAHYFRKAGLREGDTVAVMLENNEHIHAVMWAARRSGLYYATINNHLTAAEAAYIVDNSGAKAVIGSRATREVCAGLGDYLPGGLPGLLMIASGAGGSATIASGALHGWRRYPDCEPDTPIDDELEGDLLQYSSGTTGRPKGIRRPLPHISPAEAPNVLSALLMAIGMTDDAGYLSPAPLYHTAPCLWSMSALAMGATVVVIEKFDPEQMLDCIQRHGVTHGQFVPVMFVRMLKLPEKVRDSYDLSSLKRVIHAAAPCPMEIKQQMIDWWGPIVDEYYSSSEGAAGASGPDLLRHRARGFRVPPRSGEDGGVPRQARLGDRRRRRVSERRRVPVPHRPPPPHDHLGRREHLPAGGGEPTGHAPEGARCRGVRHTRRRDGPVGQGSRADRRSRRRDRRVRRRAGGLAARTPGPLQMSPVDLVRGATPTHRHRQAVQAGTGQEILALAFRRRRNERRALLRRTAGGSGL